MDDFLCDHQIFSISDYVRIIVNIWKYGEYEKKELKMAVSFEEWVTSTIHRNERGKGGR